MMKREEFFEALTDIDDEMIAAAGEAQPSASSITLTHADKADQPVKPVIVTSPKKNRKPLFTAAACVLLAASVAATAAVVMNRGQPLVSDKKEYKTVLNVINGSEYPDELYPPLGDISDISQMKYLGDEYPDYLLPSKFSSYEELAEQSQLVVMGTFTTDSGQNTTVDIIPDFSYAVNWEYSNNYKSYNVFKVEKVLKSNGIVWAGDEIIIAQPYSVVYDIGDEYNIYSFSQLTPMIKGDKWIYFLNCLGDYSYTIYGDQYYSTVNDYEGRYPVPGEENAPFKYRENVNGVVAPAVFNEGIYSELAEQLEKADSSPRPSYVMDYEKVISPFEPLGYHNYDDGYPMGLNVEFELEEFEGVTFGWESGKLYTRTGDSEERENIQGGTGVYVSPYNTYLCDLTGDGRREICTAVSIGSGIVNQSIYVLDYYNGKVYMLDERGDRDFGLEKRNGELYLLSWKFTMNYDELRDEKVEPLTLDLLKEIGSDPDAETPQPEGSEIPEETNQPEETTQPENTQQPQETELPSENVVKIMDLKDDTLDDLPITFYMEEFPDASFRYDPTEYPNEDALHLDIKSEHESYRRTDCFKKITAIYLCDLNGDGKREICLAKDDALDWDEEGAFHSVTAIDFANKTTYLLFGNNTPYALDSQDTFIDLTDLTLRVKEGILMVEETDSQTGDIISCEPFTLDMKGMVVRSDVVTDAEN